MRIRSPVPEKKSRLEIIPLIDIMFFLLASFMMISLQMQIVRTVKANLPTATLATASTKPDIVNLLVNRDGQVSVDEKAIRALIAQLSDDAFVKREAAQKRLAEIGGLALELLKKAAKESPDAETRERATQLIELIQ